VTDVLIHIGYHKSGSSWLQQHLFSRESAGFGWLGKTAGSPVRRFVDDDPLDFDASSLRQALEPLLEGPRGRGLLPVLSMERLSGHPFSGGYDCKEIADRLVRGFTTAAPKPGLRERFPALTAREADVLEAITLGHNNARIAADLFLSVATVKSYINSIFAKLGARDRAHAAAIAAGRSDS